MASLAKRYLDGAHEAVWAEMDRRHTIARATVFGGDEARREQEAGQIALAAESRR